MKRITVLITSLLLIFVLTGCNNNHFTIFSTAISQIDLEQNEHVEQLHDYDSPYTICYKNSDDTYTMYIFSSPIQYQDGSEYRIIDNTVIPSKKDGYVFENKANEIKTYFPETVSDYFKIEKGEEFMEFKPYSDMEGFSGAVQKIYTNLYGDQVSAVVYERKDMELVFYPTKAGIKMEMVLKEETTKNYFEFKVRSSASDYENKQNGYILFQEGRENKSIIYRPLVQYWQGEQLRMDIMTQMIMERKEDEYTVHMIVDETIMDNAQSKYPVKLDPSFELYLNKMPDTSVYSKFDTNSYLIHYAMIGEHPALGEGREYLRLRLNYFMKQPGKNIISAEYKIRKLYATDGNVYIAIFRPKDQWSSTQMTWSDKMDMESMDTDCHIIPGSMYTLDITEFVRQCLFEQNDSMESMGMVLSCREQEASDAYAIFATSDNSLYTPFITVKFTELPYEFTNQTNINNIQ